MTQKNQQLTANKTLQTLAWVLPLPVWPSIRLASQALRQTYTLCNQSNSSITISDVNFVPGDDSRLAIVGGTCRTGLVLAPKATCTIEVQVSPTALGTIKQVLSVQHSGDFSPLWTELLFAVTRTASTRRKASFLVDETRTMDRQRRLIEQEGHRHYGRVHAREHPDQPSEQNMAQEGDVQNNILQNPWLNSQRFDGIDPNLNPEPPLNSEARREFDNERREQEMEKQLRLGNVPRMSPAPKPQGF